MQVLTKFLQFCAGLCARPATQQTNAASAQSSAAEYLVPPFQNLTEALEILSCY